MMLKLKRFKQKPRNIKMNSRLALLGLGTLRVAMTGNYNV